MTYPVPLSPVCGRTARLPARLAQQALRLAAAHATPDEADVERDLRCHLQAHHSGNHFALVLDLGGVTTGAVWTHWADHAPPAAPDIRPDCPFTEPRSREPCCEFAGHPGAHTPQLNPPPAQSP